MLAQIKIYLIGGLALATAALAILFTNEKLKRTY